MHRIAITLSVLLSVALTASGCLDSTPGAVPATTTGPEPAPTTTTEPAPTPTQNPPPSFTLAYIAGHLGSYDDCSEQALSAEREANDSDYLPEYAGQGNCAEPGCGYARCEHAEISVRITNTGEVPIAQLDVATIQLLLWPDDRPITTEVVNVATTDGDELNRPLAAGESMDIRAQFRGLLPYRNYDALIDTDEDACHGPGCTDSDGVSNHAKIRIFIETQGHLEAVTSPTLYPITDIDT